MLRHPGRFAVAIAAIGLMLTAVFAWGVLEIDHNTEERLLEVQSRQATTVLSGAILAIETPLRAALRVQASAESDDMTSAFKESLRDSVGSGKAFVTVSLWTSAGDDLRHVTTMGERPGLAPESAEAREHLRLAAKTSTTVVRKVELNESTRVAFALADPGSDLLLYAERGVPADRRAPVDRDAAYTDLDYAIYLGEGTNADQLLTTDASPDELPFTGLSKRQTVPFGNTVLTVETTPSRHLGASLSQWLPLIVLLGGALLTAISVVIVTRLVRSKVQAEASTQTIAELYENVDALYGQQRDLFVALQRALLPQVLPEIPEFEVASAYAAGAEGVDIGGDWYSIIATDEDRFAFVVGDVSGRGVDAVAVMAHARFTLRAYLIDGDTPEVALEKCSRQFDVAVDRHMTTVLVGVGCARTGEMRVACAGHPLPLQLFGGEAHFIDVPVGPPLGTGPATYVAATVALPRGATLIAYTDGLIERRGEVIGDGMRRLADVALEGGDESPESLVKHLLESLRSDDAPDDIATLVLRRSES